MSIHRPKRVTFRSTREDKESDGPKEAKLPAWAEAMEGRSPKDFKPYAVATKYAQGDLVKHVKFGQGVVVAVEPTKIDVLFEDGTRKLAHAIG